MKARTFLSVAAIGVATATVCMAIRPVEPAAVQKAQVGRPAPDFVLPDAYGKKFTLSEFRGKIVVLEWINRRCPVSHGKHTDRTMQRTYAKYASKGVVWLAIDSSHDCDPEKNRAYAAEQMLSYPILHDPKGTVGRLYGARTTPHMYVVDTKGMLVYAGAIDDRKDRNYVADALDALLAGKRVEPAETKPYGCSVKYAPPAK